ncbi:hypothetical protein DL98DRAFT_631316 [Cadophora sp. DSE1049]|nr:hypothetical protein DL98DRAFT_631316 [Cadophora sp. DSE1049]
MLCRPNEPLDIYSRASTFVRKLSASSSDEELALDVPSEFSIPKRSRSCVQRYSGGSFKLSSIERAEELQSRAQFGLLSLCVHSLRDPSLPIMHRPYKFDPPWIDFFTRPCPWFKKQLKSFPQFLRLPRELQLIIWELAVPCRQVVCLSYPASLSEDNSNLSDEPSEIRLRYSRPGMLRACYDARVAGLKQFTLAFESYLPSPVRFNFDRDYLELDVDMVEWIAHTHREKRLPLVEPPKVEYLAVSLSRQLRAEDVVLICRYFTGLRVLLVNEPEPNRMVPTGGVPCTFFQKDANFIARHRWTDLRKSIVRPIRGVRPKLDKWTPPILVIGTDTQWAQHALKAFNINYGPNADPVDSMDWQPTIGIPSLEYVPRLETVRGPMSAVTIANKKTLNSALIGDLKDHMRIRSWVFEDSSLRFRVLDSKSGLDYDKWDWPGRHYRD